MNTCTPYREILVYMCPTRTNVVISVLCGLFLVQNLDTKFLNSDTPDALDALDTFTPFSSIGRPSTVFEVQEKPCLEKP